MDNTISTSEILAAAKAKRHEMDVKLDNCLDMLLETEETSKKWHEIVAVASKVKNAWLEWMTENIFSKNLMLKTDHFTGEPLEVIAC